MYISFFPFNKQVTLYHVWYDGPFLGGRELIILSSLKSVPVLIRQIAKAVIGTLRRNV